MEATLSEEIDSKIIQAALSRNPGVNPKSVALDTRERIAYDAIERRLASLAGQIERLEKRTSGDCA